MAQKKPDLFPKAEPHGHLQQIIDNIWYLTGSVMLNPFVRLSRNMVVIRHQDELTLINSVRLTETTEKALDALGKVTHIRLLHKNKYPEFEQ